MAALSSILIANSAIGTRVDTDAALRPRGIFDSPMLMPLLVLAIVGAMVYAIYLGAKDYQRRPIGCRVSRQICAREETSFGPKYGMRLNGSFGFTMGYSTRCVEYRPNPDYNCPGGQ
jgi:hypothetical protein